MIVSMAIAIRDEADLASGHKRKKAGDIIAVMPADWVWGTAERKQYLIVIVDLGATISDIATARKLEIPQFLTGERWYPEQMPEVIGKRRYKIPLDVLKSKAAFKGIIIDLNKVADPDDNYQPLEKDSFSKEEGLDLLFDKALKRKFKQTDMDEIKGS